MSYLSAMNELSSRSLIRVCGADASDFLQGLITQDIANLKDNEARFAALLTPQGKILFDFFLVAHDGGFLVDCASAVTEALVRKLMLYKLRAKVLIEADATLGVFAGEKEGALASFADPRLPALPVRAIAPRQGGPDGEAAYEGVRLDLGVPEFTKDFSGEEVFLLDVNYDALRAVSYTKGCFVGQEVTSRMKRKGEVRKRTLIAMFDGPAPARGEKITAAGGAIGEIMSGAEGRSLALVRLDRLAAAKADGADAQAGGQALQLVFPPYLETH